MTHYYSQEQTVATISRLTPAQLSAYVKHELLSPLTSPKGPVFSAADLARIELICDLSEQFDLKDDALAVVLSLIDQLHGVRGELRRVIAAIETQPADVRTSIVTVLAS